MLVSVVLSSSERQKSAPKQRAQRTHTQSGYSKPLGIAHHPTVMSSTKRLPQLTSNALTNEVLVTHTIWRRTLKSSRLLGKDAIDHSSRQRVIAVAQ